MVVSQFIKISFWYSIESQQSTSRLTICNKSRGRIAPKEPSQWRGCNCGTIKSLQHSSEGGLKLKVDCLSPKKKVKEMTTRHQTGKQAGTRPPAPTLVDMVTSRVLNSSYRTSSHERTTSPMPAQSLMSSCKHSLWPETIILSTWISMASMTSNSERLLGAARFSRLKSRHHIWLPISRTAKSRLGIYSTQAWLPKRLLWTHVCSFKHVWPKTFDTDIKEGLTTSTLSLSALRMRKQVLQLSQNAVSLNWSKIRLKAS